MEPVRVERPYLKIIGTMAIIITIVIVLLSLVTRSIWSEPKTPQEVQLPLYADPKRGYFVRIRIQGKEGWMLVDTGCSRTIFTQTALSSLNHAIFYTVATSFSPFKNRYTPAFDVVVPEVEIGKWKIARLYASTLAEDTTLPKGSIEGLPVMGILGYDLLRQWRSVSIDHHTLTLQQRAEAPPPDAIVFPMIADECSDPLPRINENTSHSQSIIWLIDTGSPRNRVTKQILSSLKAQWRTYSNASVATIFLRGERGMTLPFSAIMVPNGTPPFVVRHEHHQYQGLLGSALLQRYRLTLDHASQRAWFSPLKSTQEVGTFGLLLFADLRKPDLYAHFVFPYAPDLPNGFVRILSVDGVEADERNEGLIRRLLSPRVGLQVSLEVMHLDGRRSRVVCVAFSPLEADLLGFEGHTMRLNRWEVRHSVLAFREPAVWLYPLNRWDYLGDGVPRLTIAGGAESISLELKSEPYEAKIEIEGGSIKMQEVKTGKNALEKAGNTKQKEDSSSTRSKRFRTVRMRLNRLW